jgi:hypothetical protein
MTRHSLTRVLLVYASLAVACESHDSSIAPDSVDRVPVRLEVSPTSAALFPGDESQITIFARDQFGAIIKEPFAGAWAGKLKQVSSASEIAAVSSTGLIKGLAPGAADITVSLNLGDNTITASTAVTVYDRHDVSGVYDLAMLITRYDPGFIWDVTGYRYTGVITLLPDPSGKPGFIGTFEDLLYIAPDGKVEEQVGGGSVTNKISSNGRLVLSIAGLNLVVEKPGRYVLGAPVIDGVFGAFSFGGTFSLKRR